MMYYISSLALIPYFTSRAFIPLFTTALIARVGPEWAWISKAAGFELLSSVPPWTTSNLTLVVLGALAGAELISAKSPELRELMTLSDAQVKSVAAFLVCFASVGGNPLELVDHVRQVGFSTDFAGGQSVAYVWSFGIGAVVWLTASLRNAVYAFLVEIDDDDDLGLQKLLSWLEDCFGFIGVWFVIIAPALSLALAGLTILSLHLLKRYFEYREEKKKVPCEQCQALIAPCGLRCAQCDGERRWVQKVGLLGNVKKDLATDLRAHQIDLLARKRCSVCGERLKERSVGQSCQGCGRPAFGGQAVFEEYLGALRDRLPMTLGILFALGMIPLVGLIPGIIYYRLSLIASLKRYLPRGQGFVLRFLVRFLNFFLLCLQPIPLFGAVTLPLMCLTNYMVYQAAFRRQGMAKLVSAPLPA